MIRTIPGFERYGIDDEGRIMSCALGGIWKPIKTSRRSVRMFMPGYHYCVTVPKFKFCALNQIDPRFKSSDVLVSKEGRLITKYERYLASRQTVSNQKHISNGANVRLLKQEAEAIEGALSYITNKDSSLLLSSLATFRENCLHIVRKKNKTAPLDVCQYAIAVAEDRLLQALCNSQIFSVLGYVAATANGIVKEEMKKNIKIKDLL